MWQGTVSGHLYRYTDKEGASLGGGCVVMAQEAEAEEVQLALEGLKLDSIPLVVLVGDESLQDWDLAIETLERVVELRKAHCGVLEDQTGHQLFVHAIKTLQGHGQR